MEINGPNGEPSSSLVTLVGITLLSLAPTLLLMMTSFTKIFVVLALTRNALGTATVPPNMVLAGLALFLSLFVMWPVFGEINDAAVQPYLDGTTTFSQALDAGAVPLREFMLAHTREEDLALMTRAADLENPATPVDVPSRRSSPRSSSRSSAPRSSSGSSSSCRSSSSTSSSPRPS